MPCIGETENARTEALRRKVENRDDGVKYKRLITLLCAACRSLARLGYDFDENPNLSEWWANHKAEDAAREEREDLERQRKAYRKALISSALKKPISELTPEEKKLLKEEKFL